MSETKEHSDAHPDGSTRVHAGSGATGSGLLRWLGDALPVALSPREILLVAVLAGVLALAAGIGIVQGLAGYQRGVAAHLQEERDTLTELRTLAATVGPGGARPGSRTLASTLEELLSRSGMRDRVQLNPVTQAAAGRVQAMEIKAEQLTLDEMVRLVYILEGPDVPLVIDQFEVAPSFRDKELLRVSLRVLGQG